MRPKGVEDTQTSNRNMTKIGGKMKAGKVLVVEREAELECGIEGDEDCDQTVLIHNEQINCKACQRASGEEIRTTAGEGTETRDPLH